MNREKIISVLAEQIGVEPEDIADDDSFREDLHMGPHDLTDFAHNLEKVGLETAKIDFSLIETVGELIEELTE